MQTFLPYDTFEESATVLDYRRLGKQRVEGMQIINAIENPNKQGWQNHQIVIMLSLIHISRCRRLLTSRSRRSQNH